MSWDERIFGAVWRAFFRARKAKRPLEVEARAVKLETMKRRLAVLGAACAGGAVEIVASEGASSMRGAVIALPEEIDFGPSIDHNELAYVVATLFSITASRLGFVVPDKAPPAARALARCLAVAPTIDAISRDFSGFMSIHHLLTQSVLAARPRAEGPSAPIEALTQRMLGRARSDIASPAGAAFVKRAEGFGVVDGKSLLRALDELCPSMGEAPPPVPLWGVGEARKALADEHAPTQGPPRTTGREMRGKPKDRVERVDLGEDPLDENPLVHSFEKLHTLDDYQGGKKRMDGADDLAEHAEALEELDIRQIVRSRERARSLLRVDAMIESGAVDAEGDPGSGGVLYDEWEERTKSYKTRYCRVLPSTAKGAKDHRRVGEGVREVLAKHRVTTRALRERFERIERRRAWKNRQSDGTDVDLDAVVDRHGSLAAGHEGTDKLYVARRPHAPSLSIFVLVDASLSTDAWVEGRRVLDVAKESIVVLGDVLSKVEGELGVAAFYSNTRRDCRFITVKGLNEPWSIAPVRLATIEPEGYTRIGPAMRHATRLLEECQSRRKLLLLLSDGKPTDYDRYEGRHGIADVRKAVHEAQGKSIHTFALAIEKASTPYLAEMFGKGGYEILPRPETLPLALGKLVAEIAG